MKPPNLEELIASLEAQARGIFHAARAFVKTLGEKQKASDSEAAGLPLSYGEARLVLMPVDPKQVFAYWDLGAAEFRTTAAFLRFYEEGSSFDVVVDLAARNWFVPLWAAGRTYFAELGLKDEGGAFVPLAKSNVVHMPPALPRVALGERFVRVAAPAPPERMEPAEEHLVTAEPVAESGEPAPAAAAAPPPTLPDSAQTLRTHVQEISAFRGQQPEPARPPEPPAAPPPQSEPEPHYADLTDLAEQRHAFGISSRP